MLSLLFSALCYFSSIHQLWFDLRLNKCRTRRWGFLLVAWRSSTPCHMGWFWSGRNLRFWPRTRWPPRCSWLPDRDAHSACSEGTPCPGGKQGGVHQKGCWGQVIWFVKPVITFGILKGVHTPHYIYISHSHLGTCFYPKQLTISMFVRRKTIYRCRCNKAIHRNKC